jgi:hypothetical protein
MPGKTFPPSQALLTFRNQFLSHLTSSRGKYVTSFYCIFHFALFWSVIRKKSQHRWTVGRCTEFFPSSYVLFQLAEVYSTLGVTDCWSISKTGSPIPLLLDADSHFLGITHQTTTNFLVQDFFF